MGNSAKVAYICSGVKKYGKDSGIIAIFISFAGNNPESYCHARQIHKDFAKAITISETHKLINELCQQREIKQIYFCGVQPLLRYDWVLRLSQNLPLTFNIITDTADTKSLSKLLSVVDKIEFQMDLDKEIDAINFKKFIMLANFKRLDIILKTKILQELPTLEIFIKIIAEVDKKINVFLKTNRCEEFLNYHSCATKYLQNVFALNNVSFEVDNENINK